MDEYHWNIWRSRYYFWKGVALLMVLPVYLLGSYFPLFNRAMATKVSDHGPVYLGEVEEISKKALPSIVAVYSRSEKGESTGSGIVIGDGYILTNAHVIDGSQETVVKKDGKTYRAVESIQDPGLDIGIVRIKEELPAAKIASSKNLKVGQLVVAVGNALRYPDTVTFGVVSALERNTSVEDDSGWKTYTGLIQTDADINPGNSGGALLNQKGEVIGVNTLIYSTNGRSQGVGFAIPADIASRVANDLIRFGKTKHPYIGIEIRDTGIFSDGVSGALVVNVSPDTPAYRTGIKDNDVIVNFDGKKVTDMGGLMAAVRSSKIGRKMKIGIYRNGKFQKLSIIPLARPD